MDNGCVKSVQFAQRIVKFRKPRISESAYKRYRVSSRGPPVTAKTRIKNNMFIFGNKLNKS